MAAEDIPDQWADSFNKSAQMFREALVEFEFLRDSVQ
jgi:hypothetical protein